MSLHQKVSFLATNEDIFNTSFMYEIINGRGYPTWHFFLKCITIAQEMYLGIPETEHFDILSAIFSYFHSVVDDYMRYACMGSIERKMRERERFLQYIPEKIAFKVKKEQRDEKVK